MYTTRPGNNVEGIGAMLARDQYDLVVAAGGDGTVAETMAAAHVAGLPVGIVPRGTANIVARELGLPSSWRKALRRLVERFPSTRSVDLARVNDGYSALASGIGFDATVMRYTPAALKYWIGRPAYLLAGAWWMWQTPLFECTIRADGEEMTTDAVVVLVVNAGMLGASAFRFGPGISLDDGLLDLCIYRPRNGAERARVLWDILRRRPDGRAMIQRKVRSVEIKAPLVQWHEIDGDVHRGNVLKADVLPAAVQLVV